MVSPVASFFRENARRPPISDELSGHSLDRCVKNVSAKQRSSRAFRFYKKVSFGFYVDMVLKEMGFISKVWANDIVAHHGEGRILVALD